MPEVYMFFDKNRLPIAVFLTGTPEESLKLCEVLYKKSWERLVREDGFFMSKESEVPDSEWHRIGEVLKKPLVAINPRLKSTSPAIECVVAMRYVRTHYLENQK